MVLRTSYNLLNVVKAWWQQLFISKKSSLMQPVENCWSQDQIIFEDGGVEDSLLLAIDQLNILACS